MVFKKGDKWNGNLNGRPKGRKNKETLLKEERRAIFDAKISAKWEEIIDKLRPEYVADQYIGKAPEIIEVSGEDGGAIQLDVSIDTTIDKIYGKSDTTSVPSENP